MNMGMMIIRVIAVTVLFVLSINFQLVEAFLAGCGNVALVYGITYALGLDYD